MTNLVTASAPVITESGAEVQLQPAVFDANWVEQAITELGPLSVARLVELSGRSETTVRKLVKKMVSTGALWKDDEAKPATFTMIVDIPVVDEAAVIETLEGVQEAPTADDSTSNDTKIDTIMEAITAPAAPTASVTKITKSKKVAHTTVPDKHNELVQHQNVYKYVTDAYALLENPPMFETANEAYAWANAARDRSEGNHTPEEIAGLYFDVITMHLEELYDNGAITRGVWYGRTFRLRRTLVGNGKGTAAARPAVKTTDK